MWCVESGRSRCKPQLRRPSAVKVRSIASTDVNHHLIFRRGDKEFTSWSPLQGPGLVMFSAWPEQISKMSLSYVITFHVWFSRLTKTRQLRNILEFKSHRTFFNPSRADPAAMGRSPSTGNSYLTLPGQAHAFLTLTTCVMTTSCQIIHPKEVLGEQQRVISGIPHSFEYQRMEAAILTAFHENTANVQVAKDSITFMTSKNGSGCMCLFLCFAVVADFVQDASSSPAKNPSKMFRQYAGSGAGSSVFARPRMSSQGTQPGSVYDSHYNYSC